MKTNLQVLNEISNKLGGGSDAVVVTEALNNIANALGDNEPDRIKTISESLEDILEYVGGGGGGIDYVIAEQTVEITGGDLPTVEVDDSGLENNDYILLKLVGSLGGASTFAYADGSYVPSGEGMEIFASIKLFGNEFAVIITSTAEPGIYTFDVQNGGETFPATYTVTACKMPF